MCGRFTLGQGLNSLLDYFHLHGEMPGYPLSYNIAPTQLSPIVLADADQNRVCQLMRWGLVPSWSKGPDAKFNMINARAESIEQKPAYRTAYKQRRCLVPVDGYYEWSGPAKGKQPYYIYRQDKALFSLAGIWEQWELGRLGGLGDLEDLEDQGNQGQISHITSFSIITTKAPSFLQNIHHRMPVIINPDRVNDWLFESDNDHYKSLLRSMDDVNNADMRGAGPELKTLIEEPAGLAYHRVSTQVNSAKNNSVSLLEFIE